ncbi:MAG: peptidylprolyl isomerase [Ignavibacteria bacterium]|nr:peptidylprolyl isomerase [Ignavibacteria bacterium]
MSILHRLIPGLVGLFLFVSVPATSLSQQDAVVASIGDEEISLGEYETMFLKTSSSLEAARESTMEERERFLDLLTNFRLKLADAYATGLENDPEVRGEMNLYQGSLATSYLIDRDVTRPGIRGLYDERQTEYRASHILLSYSEEDSAGAYTKAYELIKRLQDGEDFGRLAVNASVDPSVQQNRGDLYYFTSGQMVRPFEEAVQGMNPGELLPDPVRTQFGLHIIKLTDKKPSSGELRCSHIMVRFSGPEPSPDDTTKAYEHLSMILDSIKAGGDFADFARRYSEDPGSSPNGGDLGWFARRRWVPEFDEQAFKLSPGEISGVIRSRYGYHIILCTDNRPAKTFEEAEPEIRKLYEQTRLEEDKRQYLDALRKETGFRLDELALMRFISELDTMRSLKYARWADSLSQEILNTPLVYFNSGSVTVDSTVRMLKKRTDLSNTVLRPSRFREAVDKIAEQMVFQAKAETMGDDYPEFSALMKEYMDGILLYQIEQERVWSKVTVTDSALQAYYRQSSDQYWFPERVRFVEIRATSDSIARSIKDRVAAGETFASIASQDDARMNRPGNYKIQFQPGSVRFSQVSLDDMKAVAGDVLSDPRLRVHVIAHPDTGSGHDDHEGHGHAPIAPVLTGDPANFPLAEQRVERIKKQLSLRLSIPEDRIATFVRPIRPNVVGPERVGLNEEVDIDIVGRQDAIVGTVDTLTMPVEEDARSKQASFLSPGAISEPFRYKNGSSLVMLLGKEPARQKTFEEAGTEVSSSFQEYESQRLEKEWLRGLRERYPVVQHKEVLSKAFAPAD